MSYFKELEKHVREKHGIEEGTFKIALVKPEEGGVKDGVRDGCSGWRLDEHEFILRYVAYLDEMEKSGKTEFEIDREVLWEQFSEDFLDEKSENLWTAVEEIVEDPENWEFFCYFLNREDELEFDEINKYLEHSFESNTGWCAEFFVLSCEEFNDILSDSKDEISVDYIGIVHHWEHEEYDDRMEDIETFKSDIK